MYMLNVIVTHDFLAFLKSFFRRNIVIKRKPCIHLNKKRGIILRPLHLVLYLDVLHLLLQLQKHYGWQFGSANYHRQLFFLVYLCSRGSFSTSIMLQ